MSQWESSAKTISCISKSWIGPGGEIQDLGSCGPQTVKAGASIKSDKLKGGMSTVSEYYIQRNKIIFACKFTPWALPTIYFGLAMAIVKRLANRQWHEALLVVKVALFLKRPQGIPGRAD